MREKTEEVVAAMHDVARELEGTLKIRGGYIQCCRELIRILKKESDV